MLENRHCNRIYYPALELLEFFACDGILGKHASTSNNRTIVDLIKKRLEVSSNVRELCSSIKLCVYMGLSLLTHRNCPKSPIFFEYLELATSGLSHRYPRVRDVTFENIYSHYTMLLCCTGIDEIPRAIFEEIDEAHPLVFTSISDEDAENVKTKLLDAMRPYSYFPTDEYTRQHVEKTLNAG